MTTPKTPAGAEILQIKVTLLGAKPPVWRRLLVPAGATFEQLHYILQTAMGWQNCHMHEFSAGPRRIGEAEPPDEGFPEDTPAEKANNCSRGRSSRTPSCFSALSEIKLRARA